MDLQGVGTIAGVALTAGTLAWATLRKHRLFHLMRERAVLVLERELYQRRWQDELARADAAEKRAYNWEGAAKGAAFDHDQLLERVGDLENAITPLMHKFNALLGYTHRLIEYTVELERVAIDAGADVAHLSLPVPPTELTEELVLPDRRHRT